MPLSALLLVLLAGSIHAIWNIAAKKAYVDIRFSTFTSWVMRLAWATGGSKIGRHCARHRRGSR